jgi:ureidoglycolate lyase
MTGVRRLLPVEPLSRAAFAPYGELVDAAGVEPQVINAGTARKFADLARVEMAPGLPAALGIYRAEPRELPMALLELERHPLGSQAFVPLRPARYLVAVAGRREEPRPEDLRVFLASGQQGVNLHAGVWHHALLLLDRESEFLVVERARGEGNLEQRSIAAWELWVGGESGAGTAAAAARRQS